MKKNHEQIWVCKNIICLGILTQRWFSILNCRGFYNESRMRPLCPGNKLTIRPIGRIGG